MFGLLLFIYQFSLETQMRGIDFIFDYVYLLFDKCHKKDFKLCGSYTDSLDRTRMKKATINPKSDADKCFPYAATVTLNFDEIKKDPQRVSKIKPFINNYNRKIISYQSKIKYCKTFEWNNLTIAINNLNIKEKNPCLYFKN